MKMTYRVIGGLAIAAGVGGIIAADKRVGCDSPEVKEVVVGKVGDWLNLINNGVGNQPGMPEETLDLLAGGMRSMCYKASSNAFRPHRTERHT